MKLVIHTVEVAICAALILATYFVLGATIYQVFFG